MTTETSSTPQLGDFPSDDSNSGSSSTDIIRNAVVATVIGVGCVATLCLFVFCGILHCYLSKDKGQYNYMELVHEYYEQMIIMI